MVRTTDLDVAGLPVHPDPVTIIYEFAGILAFIKINYGWNFHHGAGNGCKEKRKQKHTFLLIDRDTSRLGRSVRQESKNAESIIKSTISGI